MKLAGIEGISTRDLALKLLLSLALFPSTLVLVVAVFSAFAVDALSLQQQWYNLLILVCRALGVYSLWWLVGRYHLYTMQKIPFLTWGGIALLWLAYALLPKPFTNPVLLSHELGIIVLYGYMPLAVCCIVVLTLFYRNTP